jgi:hypothetical protein
VIVVNCPGCNRTREVSDFLAGMTVVCTFCKSGIQVASSMMDTDAAKGPSTDGAATQHSQNQSQPASQLGQRMEGILHATPEISASNPSFSIPKPPAERPPRETGPSPTKLCPSCQAALRPTADACPACGFELRRELDGYLRPQETLLCKSANAVQCTHRYFIGDTPCVVYVTDQRLIVRDSYFDSFQSCFMTLITPYIPPVALGRWLRGKAKFASAELQAVEVERVHKAIRSVITARLPLQGGAPLWVRFGLRAPDAQRLLEAQPMFRK